MRTRYPGGLVTCAECGCSITPERKKGKYVYYHCTEYHRKHGASWIPEKDLEEQFASVFKGLKVPKYVANEIEQTLKESHQAKKQFHANTLTGYQTEWQKLQNRIETMYEDLVDKKRGITEDRYNKKYKEYRAKQERIQYQINGLQQSDEEYYLTATYVLKLASKAYELFNSSEADEKKQLIKMLLQNLVLDGENLRYDLKKPYDTIFDLASRQDWLRGLDSNQQPFG